MIESHFSLIFRLALRCEWKRELFSCGVMIRLLLALCQLLFLERAHFLRQQCFSANLTPNEEKSLERDLSLVWFLHDLWKE